MKTTIRIALVAALSVAYLGLNAQTFHANYTYDANGNRLSATVIYLTQSPSSPNPKIDDKLDGSKLIITIYPNPTQGELRIDLSGVPAEQYSVAGNAIRVWDMQGGLLFTIKPVSTSNTVDLSGYGNGTYIVQLFFNGRAKDYKVIKN